MSAGFANAMLSVSQKAQSRPLEVARTSLIASISRSAPVISVAIRGWKYLPGFSPFAVEI